MAFLDNLKEKAAQAAEAAKQTAQDLSEKRAEKKEADQQQKQQTIEKALADAARNVLTFEIVKKEDMQFVHVRMDNTSLQTEAGAMYY